MTEGNWRGFETSFAGPPKAEAAYKIDIDDETIKVSFMSPLPAFYDTPYEPSEFIEGLWRWDCGEFWLFNPATGRYLEFNLSPTGAKWACVFVSPRVRADGTPPPKTRTEAWPGPNGWVATISIRHEEIQRCLGPSDGLRANATIILGGCPDEDPPLENLHSAVPLGAVDFHRPQDWVPLTKLI
ncbi:MAG: hypothetical protein JST12_18985 [Armatimonadetes bacterium]|nr:hypothetical protein [Armatimonadota bacterium]